MVHSPSCACPNKTRLYALLGKKWNLFIMDAIASGHHSFTEIRRAIGDANTKILTDRLGELVESGMIEKCKTEGSYGLSEIGDELMKRVGKLGEWWGEKMEK